MCREIPSAWAILAFVAYAINASGGGNEKLTGGEEGGKDAGYEMVDRAYHSHFYMGVSHVQ